MIFVSSMVMVALATNPLLADCSQTIKDCNSALSACDATIKGKDEIITKQSSALKDCGKQTEILSVDLQKAQSGRDAWYRQPATTIPIGIAIGVTIITLLRK